MTGESPVRVVSTRLLSRLPRLVTQLGERYQAEVEEYAHLPAAALESDVLSISRHVVEEFFGALAAGREPRLDVPLLEQLGRRRLEMAVSLDAMLHIFRINGRVVFDAIVEAVEPGDEPALGPIGSRWLEFLDECTSRAAIAYLHASHDKALRLEGRRRALVDAVLAVQDAADAAAVSAEFAVRLAARYVPVCLPADGPIEQWLRTVPRGTFAATRGDALVMLVPEEGLWRAPAWASEQPVSVTGYGFAPGPLLRAEVARAEIVLDIALRRGATGPLATDDLLLDQLVSSSPAVAADLQRKVLAPLRQADPDGSLLVTVSTYLETGSLTATAQLLTMHSNTVTYRLRRVTSLTGLDPRRPDEATLLLLALRIVDLHNEPTRYSQHTRME